MFLCCDDTPRYLDLGKSIYSIGKIGSMHWWLAFRRHWITWDNRYSNSLLHYIFLMVSCEDLLSPQTAVHFLFYLLLAPLSFWMLCLSSRMLQFSSVCLGNLTFGLFQIIKWSWHFEKVSYHLTNCTRYWPRVLILSLLICWNIQILVIIRL